MIKEIILATLVTFHGHPISPEDLTQGQIDELMRVETQCLAMNVYHEARNQGTAGQIAVAQVTVNRMIDSRFPNTICGVVYQGPHKPSWKGTGEMIPVRHKCQFSWYCDGKSDDIYDNETFSRIYDLTSLMVDDTIRFVDITDGATHYHADYVMPSWASTKTKTVEIEDHIFYRWEK
jgi:spore germination cell wall hydrolase CwlJ-like protein